MMQMGGQQGSGQAQWESEGSRARWAAGRWEWQSLEEEGLQSRTSELCSNIGTPPHDGNSRKEWMDRGSQERQALLLIQDVKSTLRFVVCYKCDSFSPGDEIFFRHAQNSISASSGNISSITSIMVFLNIGTVFLMFHSLESHLMSVIIVCQWKEVPASSQCAHALPSPGPAGLTVFEVFHRLEKAGVWVLVSQWGTWSTLLEGEGGKKEGRKDISTRFPPPKKII